MTILSGSPNELTTVARRPPATDRRIEPRRYTSPDFLVLENERLWSRTWQLACLASEIPETGDYCEYQVGPTSLLIVRTESGIRSYQNACLHRGRKIREGAGRSTQLRCPYHGWTWSLEGRLQHVPRRETYCPFDDDTAVLAETRVEQWHDWVFVNLDADAPPLSDHLAGMAGIIEPYQLDRHYRWRCESKVVDANWKNVVDAFNESYHAISIHPEITPYLDVTDYQIELVGDHSISLIRMGVADRYSLPDGADLDDTIDAMEWTMGAFGEDTSMFSALRELTPSPGQDLRDMLIPIIRDQMKAANVDVSNLSDSQIVDDWNFFIFPNISINMFSFGYWLLRMLPNGDDPHTSIIDMWYFHRASDDAELLPPVPNRVLDPKESAGAVMDQDLDNLEAQQAGMRNPSFPGCRLSDLEARLAHYHDVLDRYVSSPAPAHRV